MLKVAKSINTLIGVLIFISLSSHAENLDERLLEIIRDHNLTPLERVVAPRAELSRLGSMLFHEVELSGTRNINCASCHHPRFGTADALAFSIGEGGRGIGTYRTQLKGGITKRHSPHLLNLGYPEITHMFWDGRVFRDPNSGLLQTPEPALNGKNPKKKEITEVFTSALAVQAIFPIANHLEMRGSFGNDVADADGNLGAWQAVMTRLLKGEKSKQYVEQFKKAYPQTQKFNIGHVGEALGGFLSRAFNVIDTPYDSYLRGDKSAMTPSEKRGLEVFAGRGKCIKCHNGSHLSNFEFKSVGTPQLTPASYPAPYDEGRFEVTGQKRDLFKFKTPALRNLKITAPYMHDGVFSTLEQVIDHYDNPKKSLETFSVNLVDLSSYSSSFVVDRDETRNKLRINLISIGEVRRGLSLSQKEKLDLHSFLETGLLDYRFQGSR